MERASKATFAVGIFEACDTLRRALVELVTLGYQQKHLILLRPEEENTDNGLSTSPVRKLVVVLPGLVSTDPKRLRLGQLADEDQDSMDVALVRAAATWLAPVHYDTFVDAIHRDRKVLFVRMHQHRQIAPTCSILLAHGSQQVNTHEVVLGRQ